MEEGSKIRVCAAGSRDWAGDNRNDGEVGAAGAV